MKFLSTILLCILVVFPAVGQSETQAQFHTKVRLLADVRTIQPGTPFFVGIHLTMSPGWHTYWENAGEAGLPTTVEWNLPPGITAGSIIWPLPEKHIESGQVLTYGYGGETMLIVPFTTSTELRPGTAIRLKGNVAWLECEHTCIPGNAEVTLDLPVTSELPLPANAELFKHYRALVPIPYSASSDIQAALSTTEHALELNLRPEGTDTFSPSDSTAVDFFPRPADQLTLGRSTVSITPTRATISIPIVSAEKPLRARSITGVALYKFEHGGRKAVVLTIPLPAELGKSSSEIPLKKEASAGDSTGPKDEVSQQEVLNRSFVTVGTSGGSQPLVIYLLLALVGGLLLNIMPCVLPVIALKIFGLVRMAGDRPGQIKKLGWMFSLGVLASFMTLALLVIVLQAAGQQVGWGFQFQEPLFVVAMSAVVFAFGLSLFGVFEIQLPAFAITGVGNALAKQESTGGSGYVASFSEGVFATILATPCTAPFLGTALGFAFAQPWWTILLIFAIVALGMSLPYLVLTARPVWIKHLPKPGEWMVTAKQFMGFLMMATLLWLLYVLGKQLGMEAVIWTSAFLLMVGVAFWLVGRFATLTATRRTFYFTWALAVFLIAGGYWFFIESTLDIRSVIAGSAPAQGQQAGPAGGISWKPFSLKELDAALAEGQPVFIDFTAEWCLTCKVNERSVMADDDVIQKFATSGIVPIRADWTNRNPDITKLLAKFGRSGVPLYVVFPARRPDAPIILPEVITTRTVIEAIDKAVAG